MKTKRPNCEERKGRNVFVCLLSLLGIHRGLNSAGERCFARALFVFAGLGFCVGGPRVSAQQLQPQSIHALEAELHRGMVVRSVESTAPLLPLPREQAANLTHTVFGFYPYWASGYSQIRFRDLTHLAVFSVEANASGQLVNLRGWPNGPLIETAHRNGVRVVLVCTLFDSSQLQSLLSSAVARQVLINNLRNQVSIGGADGVNIDFEGVPASQKDNLVVFMRDLAAAVRSTVPGAHISIDTPAVDWSNAFNLPALIDICDALMIMGYDYHWKSSTSPGPVAPLASSTLWGNQSVSATIATYLSKIGTNGSGKLILGVPYYGYDWPAESEALNARALGQASSKLYAAAKSEVALYGRRWEPLSTTPWYAYRSQTVRQVWYDDVESLGRKYDLVFQNRLQGIGIWALTYDNNTTELWDLIEDRFVLPVPPDAPELFAPSTFFSNSGLPVALRARGSVPATAFELAVGTAAGGKDVSDYKSVGLRQQVWIPGLSLTSGQTYYVTGRSVGARGLVGAPGASVPIRIDTAIPVNRRYIPRWVCTQDSFTGLALVNPTAETQAVLMRIKLQSPERNFTASWVLQPGHQMAQVLTEAGMFGTELLGKEGWLELICPSESLSSMYLVGDSKVSRSLDGSLLQYAVQKQVFPALDGGRAQINIANPNPSPARLQFYLAKSDGTGVLKQQVLEGGGSLSSPVLALFPESEQFHSVPIGIEASEERSPYLLLESDIPVVGMSAIGYGLDNAVIPGQDVSRLIRSGAFAYVPVSNYYRSLAALVNPTNAPQSVQLRWIGGGSSGPLNMDLPANSGLSVDLPVLMGIAYPGAGTPVSGAVQIAVLNGPGVLGYLLIRSEDFRLMAALPLESGGAPVHLFPQLAQAQDYWTGISLANPAEVFSDVTVTAYNSQGITVGSYARRLSPGELHLGLLFQWIAKSMGLSTGWIEVRSSNPVLASEIFGSEALSFINAISGRNP